MQLRSQAGLKGCPVAYGVMCLQLCRRGGAALAAAAVHVTAGLGDGGHVCASRLWALLAQLGAVVAALVPAENRARAGGRQEGREERRGREDRYRGGPRCHRPVSGGARLAEERRPLD